MNLNKTEMSTLVELLERAHKSGQLHVSSDGNGVGGKALGVEHWEDAPIMDSEGVCGDEVRDEVMVTIRPQVLRYLQTGSPQDMANAMYILAGEDDE